VTDETEILEQRGEDLVAVSFEVLRVGQIVEATYAGPVAESYLTQGVAGRIVILDRDQSNALTVLPDTGGAAPLALGVLLIGGALLVVWGSKKFLAAQPPKAVCSTMAV
jgi:LPXTG-motif cell wall-anchored protein